MIDPTKLPPHHPFFERRARHERALAVRAFFAAIAQAFRRRGARGASHDATHAALAAKPAEPRLDSALRDAA